TRQRTLTFHFSMAGCVSNGKNCQRDEEAPNKKAPRGAFRHSRGLRRARFRLGIYADLVACPALVLELHNAVDERIDREVGAEADVASGVPLRAALAHDDVTGNDFLTAEFLDTAVLRIAVASVT